jgi:hypothetical protein
MTSLFVHIAVSWHPYIVLSETIGVTPYAISYLVAVLSIGGIHHHTYNAIYLELHNPIMIIYSESHHAKGRI